jgi:hypothetical protein
MSNHATTKRTGESYSDLLDRAVKRNAGYRWGEMFGSARNLFWLFSLPFQHFWEYIKIQNWFHPVCLMGPCALFFAWRYSWKVFPLMMLFELYSTGWHTSQHHPKSRLAHWSVRVLSLLAFGMTLDWIYRTGW